MTGPYNLEFVAVGARHAFCPANALQVAQGCKDRHEEQDDKCVRFSSAEIAA
jgi:hypothetical protein